MLLINIVAVATVLCVQTVDPAPRKRRLTLAEPMPNYYNTNIGGDSGAYSFGYDVFDPASGNTQFRSEERYPNGTVTGSYGYVDPLGEARAFRYTADERGYRVVSEKRTEDRGSVINANLESTTEDAVSWTRPRRKKPHKDKGLAVFQRRKYNHVQPYGYYTLY